MIMCEGIITPLKAPVPDKNQNRPDAAAERTKYWAYSAKRINQRKFSSVLFGSISGMGLMLQHQ